MESVPLPIPVPSDERASETSAAAMIGPYEKLSREAINKLPMQAYRGPLRLIRTREQMAQSLRALSRETTLGFDTETRPAFRKGESHTPALLQLGGGKAVHIFLLREIGFPPELADLLTNPDIVKAGVAVSGDIRALQKLAPFAPAGFVDLGTVAKRNGIPHHGLRGLAALLLGFRISKSERFTNWEMKRIPARSLTYAATDAWVSRELYRTLRALGCLGMTPNTGELPVRAKRQGAAANGDRLATKDREDTIPDGHIAQVKA